METRNSSLRFCPADGQKHVVWSQRRGQIPSPPLTAGPAQSPPPLRPGIWAGSKARLHRESSAERLAPRELFGTCWLPAFFYHSVIELMLEGFAWLAFQFGLHNLVEPGLAVNSDGSHTRCQGPSGSSGEGASL